MNAKNKNGIINLLKEPGSAALFGVAIAAQFFSSFLLDGIPLLLHDIREIYSIGFTQISLIRFLPISSGILLIFCAGSLCAKHGTFNLLRIGIAGLCLSGLLIALKTHFFILVIALILIGISTTVIRVTTYGMLCGAATNQGQLALLITSLEITTSTAYIASPLSNAILVSKTNQSWIQMGLIYALIFAILFAFSRTIKSPSENSAKPAEPVCWGFSLATGAALSMAIAIPITDVLMPSLTPYLLLIDIAVTTLAVALYRHNKIARSTYGFIEQPAVILPLLAVASTCLVDWNYFSERFLAIRFNMELWQTAAWLTPSNVAGLAGAALFGILSIKAGLRKTVAIGLVGCLFMPLTFMLTTLKTPISAIALSVASFAMFDILVTTGLITKATSLVQKHQYANLQAFSRSITLFVWSSGSAVTSDVILDAYENTLTKQLEPLPISDLLTDQVVKLITTGKRHIALEKDWGIPMKTMNSYLSKDSIYNAQATINALHLVGIFALATVVIVFLLSVASAKAKPRTLGSMTTTLL